MTAATVNGCARITRSLGLAIVVGASAAIVLPVASAAARPGTVHAAPAAAGVRQAPVASPTVKPVATPKVTNGKTVTQPGVEVNVNGVDGKPSSSLVILLGITALSVAPALLLMTTSFTKILVVLSITRNALGLTTAPPNQVLAGLALFLSIFIMGPTFTTMNKQAVQPYLKGSITQSKAIEVGQKPLKTFMLKHTRGEDLALMSRAAKRPNPAKREDTPVMTVIPAFMLSELRAAFIIGFVVFIPFLVIDIVISAILMSMGMMMLPPATIALPFKLLLFVMVDGWGQIITALVGSYR